MEYQSKEHQPNFTTWFGTDRFETREAPPSNRFPHLGGLESVQFSNHHSVRPV